jgi:hypothetical protein
MDREDGGGSARGWSVYDAGKNGPVGCVGDKASVAVKGFDVGVEVLPV